MTDASRVKGAERTGVVRRDSTTSSQTPGFGFWQERAPGVQPQRDLRRRRAHRPRPARALLGEPRGRQGRRRRRQPLLGQAGTGGQFRGVPGLRRQQRQTDPLLARVEPDPLQQRPALPPQVNRYPETSRAASLFRRRSPGARAVPPAAPELTSGYSSGT